MIGLPSSESQVKQPTFSNFQVKNHLMFRGKTHHFQVNQPVVKPQGVQQPTPEAWSSVLLGLAVAGLTAKLVRETQQF